MTEEQMIDCLLYAGYMYAIGVAIEIVEEVKRGSK